MAQSARVDHGRNDLLEVTGSDESHVHRELVLRDGSAGGRTEVEGSATRQKERERSREKGDGPSESDKHAQLLLDHKKSRRR